MIIGSEPGLLELDGLLLVQHAQSAADFHAQRRYGANRVKDRIELLAVWRLAPGDTHAEAHCSFVFRPACGRQDLGGVHQRLPFNAGFVVRALRAIAAILRTSAGFDGKQTAHLDLIRGMMTTMNCLGFKEKIG